MKKILFYISFIILSSCRFPHYCPEFDMEDRELITFRENDTIWYYSDNTTTKDSLALCVLKFYRNEPYEFYSSFPDADCMYEVYYQTDEVNGVFIRERLHGCLDLDVQIGNDIYSFGPVSYVLSNHTDTVASDYILTSSFVMIDNIRYNYWILQDLLGTRRFDSFTKMEYRGIIEFHDKKTGKIWKQ